MSAVEALRVAVCLVVGSVWLFLNLKASTTWLKLISVIGMLGFLGLASVLALLSAFR